jgi:hypothetical protein
MKDRRVNMSFSRSEHKGVEGHKERMNEGGMVDVFCIPI